MRKALTAVLAGFLVASSSGQEPMTKPLPDEFKKLSFEEIESREENLERELQLYREDFGELTSLPVQYKKCLKDEEYCGVFFLRGDPTQEKLDEFCSGTDHSYMIRGTNQGPPDLFVFCTTSAQKHYEEIKMQQNYLARARYQKLK